MVNNRSMMGAAIAIVMTATPVGAQVLDTLTAREAVEIATAANPMLRAARLSADASRARISQAGALPDPQLQIALMNREPGDFGSTMDPMTMDQVQLMQMVPWPGKLGNAKRAARHNTAAVEADAEERARLLAASARMAYFEIAYVDRALEVLDRTRGLLRELQNVATTMYAVGTGIQQDVLRAKVEVARMEEDITRMAQMRLAAVFRLNALLGRGAASPIPAVELPDVGEGDLPSADTLIAWALESRPALRAGAERVAAAAASLAAARRELFPDLHVGLAYQRRPAFPDMVSLMVGVRLPIFASEKQLPMRREMAAIQAMSEAELSNLENETVARILETRARAIQDRNLVALYRSSILPQSRTAVQAALSGYRVGRVTFMQLLDNQMTVNRYEVESLRLLADYHQALGELEAVVGREVLP